MTLRTCRYIPKVGVLVFTTPSEELMAWLGGIHVAGVSQPGGDLWPLGLTARDHQMHSLL